MPDVDTDDVGFTRSILDELESQYCIDTDRIYATGKSQGGGFVGVLACNEGLSQRIAAFAPVSGAFYISDFGDECDPETVPIECDSGREDIPILDFHGLADDTIAYYGGPRKGGCLPAIPYWVQTWAENDGLGLENASSTVPGAPSDSTAVRYEFGDGSQKGLVTHIMDGTVSVARRRDAQTDPAAPRARERDDLGGQNADHNMLLPTGHRARLAKHPAQQRQLPRGAASSLVQRLVPDSRLLRGTPARPARFQGRGPLVWEPHAPQLVDDGRATPRARTAF